METVTDYKAWLNRFAKLVAGATFLLIFIGALVTSTGSGLSVPDWPNTYGQFMFSFPLSKMVGGILYEHGHRMIASLVGMLTIVLAVWLWLQDRRRWLKWLGIGALAAVILQGVLGGITVLYQLPTSISVLHGCLAQAFFALTLALAVLTSRSWMQQPEQALDSSRPGILNLAILTTAAVYTQLIIGAIMRHSGAGLAIPDFPLAFGKIIPPLESQAVAIHFLHRLGALAVLICICWTVAQIFRHHREQPGLTRPASVLLAALVLQITLAAFTIWTRKAVIPTTAHVATGAFILATSVFLSLRAYLLLKSPVNEPEATYCVEQAAV